MIVAVEPQTIWIQPLDYKITKYEEKGYVQVMLKSPKDSSEPIVGTYQ
jgi:hypothetical protein